MYTPYVEVMFYKVDEVSKPQRINSLLFRVTPLGYLSPVAVRFRRGTLSSLVQHGLSVCCLQRALLAATLGDQKRRSDLLLPERALIMSLLLRPVAKLLETRRRSRRPSQEALTLEAVEIEAVGATHGKPHEEGEEKALLLEKRLHDLEVLIAKPFGTIPTTIRHAASCIALDVKLPLLLRLASVAATVLITVVQLLLLVSVTRGNYERPCLSNADCMGATRGTWCQVRREECNACNFDAGACAANVTAAMWIASLPEAATPNKDRGMLDVQMDDHEDMCAACMNDQGLYLGYNLVQFNNVAFMKWRDWLALAFASLMIGAFAAHEVCNIKLCEAALRQAPTTEHKAGAVWKIALWLVNAVRQFCVVTQLGATVVVLVYAQGGDVRNIALNSVGAIFVMEVDEVIWAHILPDQARAWCERIATVDVCERTERVLKWSRVGYVAALAIGIPVSTATRLLFPANGWEDWVGRTLYPMVVLQLLAALLLEPAAWGGTTGEVCRRLAEQLARIVLSLIAMLWVAMGLL